MKDQVVWIPGGSRGIGYACAKLLLAEGCRVAISARNAEELERAAHTLAQEHTLAEERNSIGPPGNIFAAPCDAGEEASVQAAYHAIAGRWGTPPDILIYSAGISPWSTFSETTPEEFDAVLSANLYGLFLTCRAALPAMYERRAGAIVPILSIASQKAFKHGAAYVASKFGALGLTNTLREEAREHGVRVIAVLPGATETTLWSASDRAANGHRMMQPEDVAQAVLSALMQPPRTVIEEILLRPAGGDL